MPRHCGAGTVRHGAKTGLGSNIPGKDAIAAQKTYRAKTGLARYKSCVRKQATARLPHLATASGDGAKTGLAWLRWVRPVPQGRRRRPKTENAPPYAPG